MDTNKKWIDDIRRQAGDYKRKAPEGLLDDIKKEMSRRGVMPSSKVSQPTPSAGSVKHANMKLVWGRRVAIAAAVALATAIVVTNLPQSDNEKLADNSTRQSGKPSESALNSSTTAEASSTASQMGNTVGSLIQDIIYKVKDNGEMLVAQLKEGIGQAADMNNTLVADNNQEASESPETAISSDNSPLAKKQREMPSSQQQNRTVRNWYGSGEHDYAGNNNGGRQSSFALAINYGGMGGSTMASGSPYALAMANSQDDAIFETDVNAYANLTKATSEMTTQAHHDMPIKVGINVRYNINKRWSLQSGVNYSYLSSDITRENNIEEYRSKQKLHYVSVPVMASYSIWQNKSFNVYVSGGAEAAKLVKGNADVDHVVYGNKVNLTSSKENVSEHRMQYSVAGTAGVEYKPTTSISIYAEPGVSHYFNNHSSVINIYKDKPTQFTINVGLRINLNNK